MNEEKMLFPLHTIYRLIRGHWTLIVQCQRVSMKTTFPMIMASTCILLLSFRAMLVIFIARLIIFQYNARRVFLCLAFCGVMHDIQRVSKRIYILLSWENKLSVVLDGKHWPASICFSSILLFFGAVRLSFWHWIERRTTNDEEDQKTFH